MALYCLNRLHWKLEHKNVFLLSLPKNENISQLFMNTLWNNCKKHVIHDKQNCVVEYVVA